MRSLRLLSQAPVARCLQALRLVAVVAVAGMLLPASPLAHAADPRLDRAEERREKMQESLDEVLSRVQRLEAEKEDVEAELERLRALEQEQRDDADAAVDQVIRRARESYTYGTTDPLLSLLGAEDPLKVLEQVRLLGLLAERNQEEFEVASAASRRTGALAARTDDLSDTLAKRQAALDQARKEAARLLAEAERTEEAVKETIRKEEEARRRAEERRRAAAEAARRRASRSQSSSQGAGAQIQTASSASAAVSSGLACPVGTPRSYSDTWGAPRSGGRNHKGTDILAPYGTPVYAIENGTIARMNANRLGGISLYLQGDSGNLYYYTHLAGYAGGIGVGQRVSGGQHIAVNGDTGNAAGIPHVHFEVRPGGGASVNPYPHVRRACG